VCGLTTVEIARAYLVEETTVQQRIVRAKRKLAEAGVKFDDLQPDQWAERLSSVLTVIYLIYNEGYAASSGENYLRLSLCEEALRLGRMLTQLIKDDAEALALLALMEMQSSRARARIDANGAPVPLLEQNRSLWDRLQITRGLAGLEKARALEGLLGIYFIQASIAACHARALTPEATDWPQIAALYRLLAEMTGSPVVRLNQAMAIGMAYGAEQGLAILEPLLHDPGLRTYHLLYSAHGELLDRAGRRFEARVAFTTAASMTRNVPESAALLRRVQSCKV
jgi:RNA polymerase sigma-70 factor, ECF subfamily